MFISWNCQSLQTYYHLLNIFVVIASRLLVLFFSVTALNWVTIYLKFVELNLVNKQINFGLCIAIYCTSEVPEFQVRGSLKP